ncbi:uncharacterized protein LOC124922457 [Impatiens glandulifera]|uniref:uncharacterized protein LOC124922457 n=1 Tax=Impatiens glandulifera TaxID=253017 RepID=UPI001FB09434|nr:uncharacterized protein LOC124922457 [Impatiens glandulifera]
MFGTSLFQMPEKPVNHLLPYSWVSRSYSMILFLFKILTFSAFCGIFFFWGFDGLGFNNLHKDFLQLTPNSSFDDDNQTTTEVVFKHEIEIESVLPVLSSSQDNLNVSDGYHETLIINDSSLPILDWVSAELETNYSSFILNRWLQPGGVPCRDARSVQISIPGLDVVDRVFQLSTDETHEYFFQTLDDNGVPVCLGGDYFEIDLSGESWKSRPPFKDYGNGTYSFSLQVHNEFPGDYNLTIILLYRHFEGLRFAPHRFIFDRKLRTIPIKFNKSPVELPKIETCTGNDFSRDVWSGRWTRLAKNDKCQVDSAGRYRCLDKDLPCRNQWCSGALDKLESNGWTYSTHCSFRIFSGESAWECLSGRWLFFWGDSNHCDTLRNMLNFILDVNEIKNVSRKFDMNIVNPKNHSQSVRITNIFNGHHDYWNNYLGLESLKNEQYRNQLKEYFSGKTVPDILVINSGLHDGVYWKNLRWFIGGAGYAAEFWAGVIDSIRQRGLNPPKIIYRSTVATGGYARGLQYNPAKMEAFNGVFLAELRRMKVVDMVVDHFDMTYPWHYDNRCNDGVHYGRAPANMRWRDGIIGHQYFVDLMLCHVLLNVMCAH